MTKQCYIDGCDNPTRSWGMCGAHYKEAFADVEITKPRKISRLPKRKPQLKDDVAYIPLSDGGFASIDAEDLPLVSAHSWRRTEAGYVSRSMRDGFTMLHQVVMRRKWVDHINHDKLDCRKSNLRPCTPQQNMFNRRPIRQSSSKYKGVSRSPHGTWLATIAKSGKSYRIGSFVDEEDAAIAYNIAAQLLFDEFSWLNNV